MLPFVFYQGRNFFSYCWKCHDAIVCFLYFPPKSTKENFSLKRLCTCSKWVFEPPNVWFTKILLIYRPPKFNINTKKMMVWKMYLQLQLWRHFGYLSRRYFKIWGHQLADLTPQDIRWYMKAFPLARTWLDSPRRLASCRKKAGETQVTWDFFFQGQRGNVNSR